MSTTDRSTSRASSRAPRPAPAERTPLVSRSADDLLTPGVVLEVTPAEAAAMGAFEETALSADDAWEANADLGPDEAPAAGRVGGPSRG